MVIAIDLKRHQDIDTREKAVNIGSSQIRDGHVAVSAVAGIFIFRYEWLREQIDCECYGKVGHRILIRSLAASRSVC
jgi:hypothetical protein